MPVAPVAMNLLQDLTGGLETLSSKYVQHLEKLFSCLDRDVGLEVLPPLDTIPMSLHCFVLFFLSPVLNGVNCCSLFPGIRI